MVSREVGEELVYPSLAAACLTAAVVLLLSGTVGRFLMDHDVVERLSQMPEFERAYEPDGMDPSEFIGFGATQRTLSQFSEVGWKLPSTAATAAHGQ